MTSVNAHNNQAGGQVNTDNRDTAVGFAQQIAGGFVFEIGNAWVHRRIHCISDRVGTTSLANAASGEEYLFETNNEFEINLSGEEQDVVFTSKEFKLVGYQTPNWDDEVRTLELELEMEVNDKPLPVSVYYEARAGDNFIRKWLKIGPCDLDGWTIRGATIENMRLKEMVEGVTPQPRYLRTNDNHEDRVQFEPDKVNTAEPDKRFMFGDAARAVVAYWGYSEGLYFFTESLLGEEKYHRTTGLVMKQRDWTPLAEGLVTGFAVVGAYSGAPEVGFKRYNEHLMDHWCCVKGKSMPVSWSTWMVTLENSTPLCANYDREFLLEYIEHIKQAGFYDVLHLDLGWEAEYPLQVDTVKFPKGMSEIARRAKEAGNLDMAYWTNPFSASYWKSRVEHEHPEWLVPGAVSGRSGATAICPLTDHYEHVKKRCVELAVELNARVIYWDGSDWDIRECSAVNHGHRDQQELEVKAWKRLADMCTAAHEARPDLMFVVFSIPFDNHRLRVLDQEQISDTYSFPTLQSELIQRQQLYQMTFEHPYAAIWGSWYGVSWHQSGENNLTDRPLRELIHAEMSMIGNGICQSGAGFDFKQVRPEFMQFLKKLFAFRKRFENYFNAYQHVLGFPDGKHIDGEGHVVDGKGFVVLVNPTDSEQSVKLPLDDAELELSAKKKHKLSDWSNLAAGVLLDPATTDKAPLMELGPLEVKYIGVNIS